MGRPYGVTSSRRSQCESRYQAHGRKIMEQQERASSAFSYFVCLHDDCGKSCQKKNSVINLAIVNYTIDRRNRRASSHRSHLARIPLEKLFSGRGDLLVYQEHAATSSSPDDPFTSALDHPRLLSLPSYSQAVPDHRWKIPPSAWATVLQRVEQGEPLRHIARDYSVSYEAVRRVLCAARRR